MKKLKTHMTCKFLLLIVILLAYSCNDTEANLEESGELINKDIDTIEETAATEENLKLIENLFDSIAFTAINWIETDRVIYPPLQMKPNLIGLKLDNYKDSLRNPNTKWYTDSIIVYRNGIKLTANGSTIKFREAVNDFLISDLYNKNILNKKTDSLTLNGIDGEAYAENLKNVDTKINILIKEAIGQFKEIKTKPKSKVKQSGFLMFFKDNVSWLLGFLLISVLLNIFQFIINKRNTKIEIETKIENEIETNNIHNPTHAQSLPPKLRSSEVEKIIKNEYNQLEQLLFQTYHKDCVQSVLLKMSSLKDQTLEDSVSKAFNDKNKVSQFLTPKLENHRSILKIELENCIAKDDIQQRIETSVKVQDFTQHVNTELVSEEEIQTKIQQYKQTLFSELSHTMPKSQMEKLIENLKKDISVALQKMVQDSLVFYFPFADANGMLNDDKKTKEIDRDSAIHLFVDPNDITKATFKLLYEKNDMMQAAIMSYDSFLIPICELKNEDFNSVGTKIEQIDDEDGTMEFIDGYWKVKDKLRIKVI